VIGEYWVYDELSKVFMEILTRKADVSSPRGGGVAILTKSGKGKGD